MAFIPRPIIFKPIKTNPSDFPNIPNFTILSRIGGGAYGEVFLARSVTGLYRAVKVVSRDNFELERTFEREFEGIQRYERVSQGHAGLVDVLHVGREASEDFYYYVMELADHKTGESIDSVEPDEYQPRTLSSTMKINPVMDIDSCVEMGRTLAEALGHLHQTGLTHRDVKPSNIIFLNGKPQLADIGLVAASGQRTYVGTEGYVPPEGPGTSSADLYALAMVLYEMHTGKDRLDFPELPTNHQLGPTVNRDEWRTLNAVICRAGSPDPKKRFETGASLSEALRKVRSSQGSTASSGTGFSLLKTLVIVLPVLAIIIGGVLFTLRDRNNQPVVDEPQPDEVVVEDPVEVPEIAVPPVETEVVEEEPIEEPIVAELVPAIPKRWVKLDCMPQAVVWVNDELQGKTPLGLKEFEIGELKLVFKQEGYFDREELLQVTEGESPISFIGKLKKDLRPKGGEPYTNSVKVNFLKRQADGKYLGGVTKYAYDSFLGSTKLPGVVFAPKGVAYVKSVEQRWAFCEWMTQKDREIGYLSEQEFYVPEGPSEEGRDASELYCLVEKRFGKLILNSTPEGASVYNAIGSQPDYLGKTPITLEHRIGPYKIKLSRSGYEEKIIENYLTQDSFSIPIELKRDSSVVFGEAWQNSLGLSMVPVGKLMVAAYETRVADFKKYLAAGNFNPGVFSPQFEQTPNHPLVLVNREDANLFCQWLTKVEKEQKLIRQFHQYRLPTDQEWSQIAGLPKANGDSPMMREIEFAKNYLWGETWPPPAKSGNFADASATELGSFVINQYDDQTPYTSVVGSFKASQSGIFDLAGNVWEWVSDDYGDGSKRGVLRGGGWDSYQSGVLLPSYRNAVAPETRDEKSGFRIVLVDTRQSVSPVVDEE